jgi:hypothetical protein
MIEKELLDKIKKRLNEIKVIRDLSSRDLRFKNWHASTINLLKALPPEFIADTNDFKKLAFTDTKYHRGKKFFNPGDDIRYREDLDLAVKILKKITSAKEERKTVKKQPSKKKILPGKEIKKKPAKRVVSTGRKKSDKKVKKTKSRSIAKKPPSTKIKKTSSAKTKKIKKK